MAKRKTTIPKTVLGMRVPKALRSSRAIASVLESPLAREILADVLLAAAGAAAAALARHRPNGGDGAQAGEVGAGPAGRKAGKTRDSLQDAAGALGPVLSEVARAILPGEGKNNRKGKSGKGRKQQKAPDRIHH
jgi:hypothetical protein